MTVEETLEHDAREGSLPSSANSSQPQQSDAAQARRGDKAKSRAAKAAASTLGRGRNRARRGAPCPPQPRRAPVGGLSRVPRLEVLVASVTELVVLLL